MPTLAVGMLRSCGPTHAHVNVGMAPDNNVLNSEPYPTAHPADAADASFV